MKSVQILLFLLMFVFINTGCIKESIESNDNELITTLELHFTEAGVSTPLVFRFDDADGPGGNSPVQDIVRLDQNKTYNLRVYLLDKTKNPPVDITSEVEEEGDSHRVFILSTGLDLISSNPDLDAGGLPLGINHIVSTQGQSNGKIRVVLRHYASGGKLATDGADDAKSSTDADLQLAAIIE